MNRADTNTFPWMITMAIWLKSEDNPYLVREFYWLTETERLLDDLRTFGIRVETQPAVQHKG